MPIGESFDGVLDAARTGADWAWKILYEDLAPGVLGYLRARGASDPEDLTGEVFLQVVRDLHRFSGDESSFRSWVFVIAHHRLLDDRRRRGRRPEDPIPSEALRGRAGGHDVEQDVLRELGTEHVREVIASLPEDQRDVLLLRIVGGLSAVEVGQAIGKRPGAVRALQHRAVNALRTALETSQENGP